MRIKVLALDKLVSEYVRRKSKGFCERCGRYYGWQGLQCCHYHGRRAKSTRFDEDNLFALDFGCHQYFHEHPKEFEVFALDKLGRQAFDMLEYRANKGGKPDIQLLTLYYKNEIERLKGGLG